MTGAEFWAARLDEAPASWTADAKAILKRSERRRQSATYNTGSITVTAAVALRSVAAWARATKAIEVGTFIGNSTLSIRASGAKVLTCDASNDCLEPHPGVTTFPKHTSTQMLRALVKRGVVADFAFIDGRLGKDDPGLMRQVMTPDAVYVFDDYYFGHGREGRKPSRKGTSNVSLIGALPGYVLLTQPDPMNDEPMTLAALVPESRL